VASDDQQAAKFGYDSGQSETLMWHLHELSVVVIGLSACAQTAENRTSDIEATMASIQECFGGT
jgi:hypothetical protein